MQDDYNKKYYSLIIRYLHDMKYYYGDLTEDCEAHIRRYYPNANTEEMEHAIKWALADAWNGGCEVEQK